MGRRLIVRWQNGNLLRIEDENRSAPQWRIPLIRLKRPLRLKHDGAHRAKRAPAACQSFAGVLRRSGFFRYTAHGRRSESSLSAGTGCRQPLIAGAQVREITNNLRRAPFGISFDEKNLARPVRGGLPSAVPATRIDQPGGMVMNKDEMEGKWDKTKGKVKENVGRAVNDREMEQKGLDDQAKGNVQEGFGKARRNVGEAIEDLGDKIKR